MSDQHVMWRAEIMAIRTRADSPIPERYFELAELIADTPATTIAGVAAQAHLLREQVRPEEQSVDNLTVRLIDNICESLDRLAASG